MSEIGSRLRMAVVTALPLALFLPSAQAADAQVNTIRETIERIQRCWQPPPAARASPMDITVIVSFNRSGEILGRPRISYETPDATDSDRLQYRVAVMEALQRCTPMPFTESMAGAAAGHPFWIRFHTSKPNPTLQPQEKRAWLPPKIL